MNGLPVRVIRGAGGEPTRSPKSGYRYDGLYFVDAYWHERGRSGFRIWRYRLVKEQEALAPEPSPEPPESTATPVPRTLVTVQREIRSTSTVQTVKQLHNHRCQVCGQQIMTPAGPYAEGAHIRPLGRPHDGPDVPENILCLCPNDHVRFDYGALLILDDLRITDGSGNTQGTLMVAPGHAISRAHLAYHRDLFKVD
jgi:putative restriction endonuclease